MTRKPIQRLTCLARVALLSVIVSAADAEATTIDFSSTGSIVTYTVPATGVYEINAFGAEGGVNSGIGGARSAGLGADASGQFSLTAGETLRILVGGQGGNGSGVDGGGGGGGGSFVALAGVPAQGSPGNAAGCSEIRVTVCADTLLVAAGGGGGAGTLFGGVGGQTGSSGASANIAGSDGALFGGGAGAGAMGGGGGGGYIHDGFGGDPDNACDEGNGSGCGGTAFLNGGTAGAGGVNSIFGITISTGGNGGFGGGGGAGGAGAGGGGGGYSGGGGGDQGSGGGGGSYINDSLLLSDEVLAGGVRGGDGEVVLTFQSPIAVPEPSSLALLGIASLMLGVVINRPRRRYR
jgi:hypothetical protein